MNVELSRIAQKKLEQMAATVHGVLVKNEAGAWAAVSDAGRVMWLDDEQPGSEDHKSLVRRLDIALNGAEGAAQQASLCDIVAQVEQAARAQSGQGVPEETRPLPVNRYGVDRDYFTKKLEILIRDMRDYTPDELARSLGRLAMTASSETMQEAEFTPRHQPAQQGVPANQALLSDVVSVAITMLYDSHKDDVIEAFTVDELQDIVDRSRHLQSSRVEDVYRAAYLAVLRTAPQPEGDGWIKCSERLPTEADADPWDEIYCEVDGVVDRCSADWLIKCCESSDHTAQKAKWKPTGLKRPQPPQEGA